MKKPIIEAQHVSFKYDNAETSAVKDVSLTIEAGEFLAILGRNGSGKSTFAKLLNALLLPTEGTLTVNGLRATSEDDCYEVRKSCGMVFQNPDNQIVTTIVEEDCAFGLENLGTPPAEIRRRVDEALHSRGHVGLRPRLPLHALRRPEAARRRGRRAGHAAEDHRVRRIHRHARPHRPARRVLAGPPPEPGGGHHRRVDHPLHGGGRPGRPGDRDGSAAASRWRARHARCSSSWTRC